jgi:hypothetical protein
MPIVKDNYWEATMGHKDYNISVGDAHDIKVNMTVDVLDGCIHACEGCFVNRRRQQSSNDQFSKVLDAQKMFNQNNIRFSSIILGPTDVFGNLNIQDVLKFDSFKEVVSNCTTVGMISTLLNDDSHINPIIDGFNAIPKCEGFLYDFQVVIDVKQVLDPEYRKNHLARIHNVLNRFTDPLNFTIIFNMDQDFAEFGNLAEICRVIKEEYDTIVEPIPSYQRYGKGKIHNDIIRAWVDIIEDTFTKENQEYLAMTIADKNQGGALELNYTYSAGEFYSTPFVYEVALIRDKKFRVKDPTNIKSWTNIKTDLYMDQLAYSPKTLHCETCNRREICLKKHVLSYMEHFDFTECVYPREVLNEYRPLTC